MAEQDNSEMRTLYFHTGIHKTGSTALQVYIKNNSPLLEEVGVAYEFPSGADMSSGNGQYLFSQMHLDAISDDRLDEILNIYLSNKQAAICSSEDFTRFCISEWGQIMRSCQRIGVMVKIVAFVRNVAEYYFSQHGQLLKGGEIRTSFEEFCDDDQYLSVISSIKAVIDVFGRDAVKLAHYDSSMEHLDVAFMECVGLSPQRFDASSLKTVVNRSLTEYEKSVLSKINEATGRQYSLDLSTFLMNRRPSLREDKRFDPHIIDLLTRRHMEDISWINKIFFGGADVLKIGYYSAVGEADLLIDVDTQRAIDADVFDWFLARLKSVQVETIEYVSTCLRNIDWKNSSEFGVPNDFDPVAYLLLNPDLLSAGASPFRHFIDFGRHEGGRKWKWD